MPWVRAAARSALDGRAMMAVRCNGQRVALYALDDGVYATSDTCPHLGALLSYGTVVQGYVECPMHHALFDIRTGETDGSVTDKSVRTFPVKVEEGEIYVELPAMEENAS
ncbi:MAG: Rieske 2Fe-2S domain-containing protein [Acidobacteriota bacterium]